MGHNPIEDINKKKHSCWCYMFVVVTFIFYLETISASRVTTKEILQCIKYRSLPPDEEDRILRRKNSLFVFICSKLNGIFPVEWSFKLSWFISLANKFWKEWNRWPTRPRGPIFHLKLTGSAVLAHILHNLNKPHLSGKYWLHYSKYATCLCANKHTICEIVF